MQGSHVAFLGASGGPLNALGSSWGVLGGSSRVHRCPWGALGRSSSALRWPSEVGGSSRVLGVHRGELKGSSGRLWRSWWVLGRVLAGAQAVPGTFAGDLKNSEKRALFMVFYHCGAHCVPSRAPLEFRKEAWVSFGMSFGAL